MLKAIRVVFFVGIILITFTGTANAFFDETIKEVEVVFNDGYSKTYETDATDVEDFLIERSIPYLEGYDIAPDLNTILKNGMTINIHKKFTVNMIVDDKPVVFETKEGSIEELVKRYSKITGSDYEYDKSLDGRSIDENLKIELTSFKSKKFEQMIPIEYKTEYIETKEMEFGEEVVVTEGIEGEMKRTVLIDYRAGQEVNKEILEEIVIKEPVTKVVQKGTSQSVKVGEQNVKYKKQLNMNASAYTANYVCTGKGPGDAGFGITASGMKARYGVVAVDPKVIPLGTKLYIEGYGEAVAGDTGGAIKGNKIDLYYNSYDECLQFGRRTISVYILED